MSDASVGPLAGEFTGTETDGVRDFWGRSDGTVEPAGSTDGLDPGRDTGLSPRARPLLGDEPSDASPEPR